MSTEDRILFESVARAILTDKRGTLGEQIGESRSAVVAPRLLSAGKRWAGAGRQAAESAHGDLLFFNGLGGFTAGWQGVRHHNLAGANDSRALGERAGESRTSARSFQKAGSPIHGAKTRTNSGSLPGPTIR